MVLTHDRGQVGRTGGPQPLRPNVGVVEIDVMTPCEPGPRSTQPLEQARGRRAKKDRQAALHHGKLGAGLADVVQQGRLLQQPVGLNLELHHRREHVQPVSLIVDR